jgi:hypothetical protein
MILVSCSAELNFLSAKIFVSRLPTSRQLGISACDTSEWVWCLSIVDTFHCRTVFIPKNGDKLFHQVEDVIFVANTESHGLLVTKCSYRRQPFKFREEDR